jgi:hypothetical protein
LVALCDLWVERLVVQLSEQHVLMLDDLAHRPALLVQEKVRCGPQGGRHRRGTNGN